MITCPQCNAQNLPGMAYCENCGSPLPQQADAPASPSPAPVIDATPIQTPAPDPVAAAMPQPVMPVDQPPAAPDLHIPSPAAGANVVAAEPDAAPAAPSEAAPIEAAPASVAAQAAAPAGPSDGPATDQSAASSVDQSNVGAAASAPASTAAGAGTLTITFPSGQTFTMQGDEANVGRADVAQNWHPELDVIPYGGGAPDLGVSRHHARIVHQDGGFSVVDLGSTNGTYINGHAAAYNQPAALSDGDTLSFGALNTTIAIK